MAGPEDSSVNIAVHKPKPLRRQPRKKRPVKQNRQTWLTGRWQELLITVLATLALAMMIVPQVYAPLGDWGLEWLGLILLTATIAYGAIRIHHHLLYRQVWWRRHGCPECGQYELRRQRRTSWDRVVNRLGFPRRRYICPDCHWRGPLIDDAHI